MSAIASFPSLTAPGPRPVSEVTEPWWIGRVKSRQENLVAETFAAMRIDYVLPFERVRKRHANRVFYEYLRPVFPGYCFFAGSWDVRYAALATNRLLTVIEVAARTQPVLAEELERLQETYADCPAPPMELGINAHVRIVDGAYWNTEGTIAEMRKHRAAVKFLTDDGPREVEVDLSSLELLN
jgi:transcription antitermination factor NusG